MRHAERFASLVIAATALPLLAGAQTKPVVAQITPAVGCPVMVTAKYVPGAAIRPVGPPTDTSSRQPLHVSFGSVTQGSFGNIDPGATLEVREARVRVRGITEKGGVIPAGVTAPSSPWLEKTFTVNVTRNAAGVLTSTIWLTGYGAVSDVRVDGLTFADGKTWKPAPQESCHAATGTVLTSSR